MKTKVTTYVEVPTTIYYIDYIYNYRDCEYPEYEPFENKFFYSKETAYEYAKFKGLTWEQYDIEELHLGAINKDFTLQDNKNNKEKELQK